MAVIAVWFVGVASLAAFWRHDPAFLAILLLPASIVAALLVVASLWRAAWLEASRGTASVPRSAAAGQGSNGLDDVVAPGLPVHAG